MAAVGSGTAQSHSRHPPPPHLSLSAPLPSTDSSPSPKHPRLQPDIGRGKWPRDPEVPEEAFVSCPDGMRSPGAARDAQRCGQP